MIMVKKKRAVKNAEKLEKGKSGNEEKQKRVLLLKEKQQEKNTIKEKDLRAKNNDFIIKTN